MRSFQFTPTFANPRLPFLATRRDIRAEDIDGILAAHSGGRARHMPTCHAVPQHDAAPLPTRH